MEEIDHEAQVDAAEDIQDDALDQELPEETTDWKAEAIKARRIASRYRNQAIKAKEAKRPEPTTEPAHAAPASTSLDLTQKAFLRAEGIKSAEELALVADHMKNTGKAVDDVVDSKFFQAELKELRDAKVAQEAMPSANKRAGTSAKDDVSYWIAKGELPPATAENVELRRKVVAAKRAAASGNRQFYNS